MKWENLKINKCPKCSKVLLEIDGFFQCPGVKTRDCSFIISKTKFESVVNSLYRPRRKHSDEDNLSALNNL